MDKKTIQMKCQGAIRIDLDRLEEFQGELKSLSKANYLKLRTEILEEGFSFCPHVWKGEDGLWYLIDGHQRTRTLRKMVEEDGYYCPEVPCSIVEASSGADAERKVLAATSQYGHIEKEGLLEFTTRSNITPSELRERFDLPGLDIERFIESNFDKERQEPSPIRESDPSMRHSSEDVKKVSLQFTEEVHSEFLQKVDAMRAYYETQSLADTVLALVREVYEDLVEEKVIEMS